MGCGEVLERNLSWVVAETIHGVNNALAGIQYAVYTLQAEGHCDAGTEVRDIQERTEEIATTLRSLYELVNPLVDEQDRESLDILCERVHSLLARRLASQGITWTADIPDRFILRGPRARLFSQILFTYLWLRSSELNEGDRLELGAWQGSQGAWLRVVDSGSAPAALGGESDRGQQGAVEDWREEFARRSLKQLASGLGPGGFRPLEGESGYQLFISSEG